VLTCISPEAVIRSGLKEDFSEDFLTRNPIPCRESYAPAAKQQTSAEKKKEKINPVTFRPAYGIVPEGVTAKCSNRQLYQIPYISSYSKIYKSFVAINYAKLVFGSTESYL
jgi:hypothetical protein